VALLALEGAGIAAFHAMAVHFLRTKFTAPVGKAGGAATQVKIGPLILLRVLGDVKEKLTLESLSVPHFVESPPIMLSVRFRNEGTVHEAPIGDIEVQNLFGEVVATGTLPVQKVTRRR
jgi:hypothetical protein